MINIKNMKNEALASQIVVFRLLGLNKKFSIQCMEELMFRKKNGDEFDYDSFIKEELEKSPKLNNESNNILKNLINIDFGKLLK